MFSSSDGRVSSGSPRDTRSLGGTLIAFAATVGLKREARRSSCFCLAIAFRLVRRRGPAVVSTAISPFTKYASRVGRHIRINQLSDLIPFIVSRRRVIIKRTIEAPRARVVLPSPPPRSSGSEQEMRQALISRGRM